MEKISDAVKALANKKLGEYRIHNGELSPRLCPFCKGGRNEDTYTFSIGLYNGAFNCMRGSCGKKGSFRELCNYFGIEAPDDGTSSMSFGSSHKLYSRPDESLYEQISEEALAYIKTRGISEKTTRDFALKCDAKGNIVFPFYRDNRLIFVKFREPRKFDPNRSEIVTDAEGRIVYDIDGNPKTRKARKEWAIQNTEPILFNMDRVSFSKPLIITEGEFDCMAVYEAGFTNVVSVPMGCNNFAWVDLCWNWLEKFQQIILFGDMDDAGIAMMTSLMQRLGEDRCMMPPEYPEAVVNGKSLNRQCKDANEILVCYGKEGIESVIEQCHPAPVKGMLNLANVQFVDPTSIPRIYTRIPALDNAIGGLGEGGLTILTGKRGRGKSTVSGNFMLNAIEQGYSVCSYSGELNAYKYLEWILLQATESKYVGYSIDPRSGKRFASVDPEIQKRIKAWIDNKFYLFDNSYSGSKTMQETILDAFTICARRYGCKLFLVDNLLVALNCTADQENKAQADFAAALKAFAVRFKAHVILVAHPRKTKPGEELQNDDVAGSSALTNLADNVISVDKPDLKVIKNRDFGELPFIACQFNPANRRIFQSGVGDRIVYGWDHNGIEIPQDQACVLPEFAIQQNDNKCA